MAVAMLASNLPAPLYELYRQRFGFSTFAMTGVFAIYPLALVVTLIACARVPDVLGRRAALVLGVIASAIGAVLFALAGGIAWLFAGRIAAAVAIGLVGAAGPPLLVELRADGDRRAAALVATFALSLACGLAPAFSGVLAALNIAPFTAAYWIDVAIALAACAALLVLVPETRPQRAAAPAAPVRFDAAGRRSFAIAALSSGIGWWIASLFVSLVPSYLAALLGVRSPAAGGVLALIVFVVSPVAMLVARGWDERITLRLGMTLTIAAIAGILIAVPAQSLALFTIATFVAGIAQGTSFFAAQTMANRLGRPEERARISARFYAVTYLMVGGPVLAMGALATRFGFFTAFAAVGGAFAVAALGVLLAAPAGHVGSGEDQLERDVVGAVDEDLAVADAGNRRFVDGDAERT
jgi:predicted MFS family arabinose efflux permease